MLRLTGYVSTAMFCDVSMYGYKNITIHLHVTKCHKTSLTSKMDAKFAHIGRYCINAWSDANKKNTAQVLEYVYLEPNAEVLPLNYKYFTDTMPNVSVGTKGAFPLTTAKGIQVERTLRASIILP